MGDIQDWTKIVGIYRRRAEQRLTEIRCYQVAIALLLIALLAGCTTETNTALIFMLGDAVSSSTTTGE